MSALPSFITFTGLDTWTDLDRVEDLSRRYPIEWGVLFSPKRQGDDPRYPALFTVDRIVRRLGNLRLAAHLCGDHARSVLSKASCPDLTKWIDCEFGRFQVNTADPSADPRTVARFAHSVGGTGILQCRGPFPAPSGVDWLFDTSGGNGEAPRGWPAYPGRLVGYAGGLNAHIVAAVVERIGADGPYWIDMETGVRTDDRLDLDKCEAVCRAVYGPPLPSPTPLGPLLSERGEL